GCNELWGIDEPYLRAVDGAGGVEAGMSDAPRDGMIGMDTANPQNDGERDEDVTVADASRSEGGAVPPTTGGIFTVNRVPSPAGAARDASGLAVTEDGFEFGETRCGGAFCVTGAVTP